MGLLHASFGAHASFALKDELFFLIIIIIIFFLDLPEITAPEIGVHPSCLLYIKRCNASCSCNSVGPNKSEDIII